jgi:hypothetical protein
MNYRVRLSKRFETSYQRILKRYYKKDKRGAAEFDKVVNDFTRLLQANPRNNPPIAREFNALIELCEPERWPSKSARHDSELWKARIKLPRLGGAVREGRVLYLLNVSAQRVELIWIYTHQDYAKRPPDAEIEKILNEAFGDP